MSLLTAMWIFLILSLFLLYDLSLCVVIFWHLSWSFDS